MRLTLTGIGPAAGFPLPDCPCATCSRARRDGVVSRPAQLESSDGWALGVDGEVELSNDRLDSVAAGEGVRVVRLPELGTIVWAPQGGEPEEAVVGSLVELLAGEPARAVYLGPAAEPATEDGEMPSVGCARTLARLRAKGVIGPQTRSILLGFGHEESHPGRLAACLPVWGAELGRSGLVLDLSESEPAVPPLGGRVLVLGGSGSGKSAFAEQMLSAAPEVVYIATGPKPLDETDAADSSAQESQPGDEPLPTEHPEDDEWAARVEKHKNRRPDWWGTLETIEVAGPLADDRRAVLLDSVGTWLSGVLDACGAWEEREGWREALDAQIEELLRVWRERPFPLVAVSDEVGWSIVPATESGRLFRDQLGRLNAKLADASEDVFVVVAGRLVRTEP
ncbi:bifunctional adenosylcobinamide kinase/adenosylcobinamide-phosphate guanylyltransferase [Kineosporia rhizophila]|uniref:bifunctional adenosylcobinamide kinase/adenosylcobinamide-phosphate guanylyltransferase n=1 Tax=Kineosporia rhizophila TaxID=84633 RepID=UPI001E65CEAB|nr:bifunctional adenosylcobinamide kinase/adenosylcobinamide-phosphate guanylyltransferase [Kineosporia rhizophila]MCE0538275.1 bifunctional adenosylcobinamide kinase/adenosylcobinamide-phosphate guanylyltransferase [Kineosporia rhizophila]